MSNTTSPESPISPTESAPERKPVTIYVRLGTNRDDDSERVVSFGIPNGIDPLDLLAAGFAIDGNQAAYTISPDAEADDSARYSGPFDTYGSTLTGALNQAQKALVAYLRKKGFEPKFG